MTVNSLVARIRGHSQVIHRMNFAIPAIGSGLAGKDHDFLLGPFLVPRQSGQGDALVAGFSLSLHPGTDFLLYKEVSVRSVLVDIFLGDKGEETDEMGILWPDAVGSNELLHVYVHKASVLEQALQFHPGTDLISSLLKRAMDFIEVLLEPGVIVTAVL